MGNSNSTNHSNKKLNTNAVLHKNKKTVETLEKRIAHLEQKIKNEVKLAKIKIKNNNKQKALLNLKKKKMYQKQIENLTAQMFNLEQQSIVLEGSILNNQIFDTMNTSKNTLKRVNKNVNVDTVEDLMDNLNTQMSEVEEVNQVLSQPIDNDEYDEDELLKELESDSETPEETNNEIMTTEINLPNVPTEPIKNIEEKALDELEKMMEA
jgi:charged multivesicular body protein 4A/B